MGICEQCAITRLIKQAKEEYGGGSQEARVSLSTGRIKAPCGKAIDIDAPSASDTRDWPKLDEYQVTTEDYWTHCVLGVNTSPMGAFVLWGVAREKGWEGVLI